MTGCSDLMSDRALKKALGDCSSPHQRLRHPSLDAALGHQDAIRAAQRVLNDALDAAERDNVPVRVWVEDRGTADLQKAPQVRTLVSFPL